MSKTKKKYKKKIDGKNIFGGKSSATGGKAIASGGYGCVFNPSLKCHGSTKREKNKISKLMTSKHAKHEYEEINRIKGKLDKISNYKDYFLLYDATICKPDKLSESDLIDFNDKCSALPKDNIIKQNINDKLDELMTLNMPNGGKPVDDFIYENGSLIKLHHVHNNLIKLLKNGIIPMNKHNVYHCDIKDSNILVDESKSTLKTRLIDWGLSLQYKPSDEEFPNTWKNRPLQFNVPFSVVIFSNSFVEKYTSYLKGGGKINEESLKPFITDYLQDWMKERGAGHYKFINEVMYKLYSNDYPDVSEKNKPTFIETQITIPYILDYIINILIHFTKLKENGEVNVRYYLNELFIKIVDIYGFINVYYPFVEMLSNNYDLLDKYQLALFNSVKEMFYIYLYKPRHEEYNMNELYLHLKKIGTLITKLIDNENSNKMSNVTKKSKSSSSKLFKRKPFIKRFKNPFFLLLK